MSPDALVTRAGQPSIDARLLRDVQAELKQSTANQAAAGFYDARTESIVGWTPLRSPEASDLFLVSIVRAELALTDLPVYLAWLGVFTLAGILVVLIIAIANASIVLQGIQSIYAMVRNLGDGNLAVRRGAPGLDESGMLTIDLNHFLANLSGIIQRIRETVDSVAGEIQSPEKTARELSGGAQSPGRRGRTGLRVDGRGLFVHARNRGYGQWPGGPGERSNAGLESRSRNGDRTGRRTRERRQ